MQVQHHPLTGRPILFHNNLNKFALNVPPYWEKYEARWRVITPPKFSFREHAGEEPQMVPLRDRLAALGYEPERACWEMLMQLRCARWFERYTELMRARGAREDVLDWAGGEQVINSFVLDDHIGGTCAGPPPSSPGLLRVLPLSQCGRRPFVWPLPLRARSTVLPRTPEPCTTACVRPDQAAASIVTAVLTMPVFLASVTGRTMATQGDLLQHTAGTGGLRKSTRRTSSRCPLRPLRSWSWRTKRRMERRASWRVEGGREEGEGGPRISDALAQQRGAQQPLARGRTARAVPCARHASFCGLLLPSL